MRQGVHGLQAGLGKLSPFVGAGKGLGPILLAPNIFVVTHESSGTPIRALRPTP